MPSASNRYSVLPVTALHTQQLQQPQQPQPAGRQAGNHPAQPHNHNYSPDNFAGTIIFNTFASLAIA